MITRRWRSLRNNQQSLRRPRDFVRARDSAVAIIVAIAMIPMLVAAGGALDVARLSIAKARLISALDAALLAVGASNPNADQDEINQVFNDYFKANFPTTGKVGTVTPDPITPNVSGNDITATAEVTIDTYFLKLIGIDTLSVAFTSHIVRQTTGLELALVLDNTGSMLDDNKLDDLKTAVGQLLDTVFNGETEPAQIRVGIVPYVAAVNIGTGNAGYVLNPGHEYPVDDGADPTDPIVDTQWKGCVEARNGGYDVTDDFTVGGGSSGEWSPYFWESPHYYRLDDGTLSSCINPWWRRLDGIVQPLPRQSGLATDPSFYVGGVNEGTFRDHLTGAALTHITPAASAGPNRACPTPITPLTNVRSTLDDAVTAMDGWDGNGTIINTGVVWGWRVLSPTEPFTEGVAYGTADTHKVMVIMTDGLNNVPAQNFLCYFPAFNGNPRYNSYYTAYGYASENRLGTTDPGLMDDELDTRLATLCSNIKDPSTGITIYTITLGMDDNAAWDPIKTRMRNCATSPAHYFNAPSGSELQSAFAAIGAQLLKLRVAE